MIFSRKRIWNIVIFLVLFILALIFVTPTLGVILSSLKTKREIAFGLLWTLPAKFYLENYINILNNSAVHQYFLNTIYVTIPATVGSICFGTLLGYVFANMPFRGSNVIFLIIVSGMFFPPQTILVPLFRLFNWMNLLDTLWPMIIIHIAMGIPICTLLLRNFFATIPEELYQSARVDGANEWQILIRVFITSNLIV